MSKPVTPEDIDEPLKPLDDPVELVNEAETDQIQSGKKGEFTKTKHDLKSLVKAKLGEPVEIEAPPAVEGKNITEHILFSRPSTEGQLWGASIVMVPIHPNDPEGGIPKPVHITETPKRWRELPEQYKSFAYMRVMKDMELENKGSTRPFSMILDWELINKAQSPSYLKLIVDRLKYAFKAELGRMPLLWFAIDNKIIKHDDGTESNRLHIQGSLVTNKDEIPKAIKALHTACGIKINSKSSRKEKKVRDDGCWISEIGHHYHGSKDGRAEYVGWPIYNSKCYDDISKLVTGKQVYAPNELKALAKEIYDADRLVFVAEWEKSK